MVHEHGSLPLDPMQRIAVEAAEGVSLVTGGAGTGKTHALVGRVAHLLDVGVQPGHITCVAVGEEAAAALRRRLASHPRIGGHIDDMAGIFVGTMDEYANLFLRRAGAAVLGLSPGYTLWDRRTAVEAVRTAWPGHHTPDLKQRDIEAALDWHWLNRSLPAIYRRHPAREERWIEVEELYIQEKRLQGALDQLDLLVLAVAAMTRDGDLRAEWSAARTRHLLVDCLEDLTMLQHHFLELIAGRTGSLMVAADPNQAMDLDDPEAGMEFFRLNHQGRERHHLRLTQAASRKLADVAEALQRAGLGRGLWDQGQVSDGVSGGAPVLVEVEGTQRELYTHCLEDAQGLADDGMSWEDMAILYRRGDAARRLATQLVHRDIPFQVLGRAPLDTPGDTRLVTALLASVLHPKDLHSFRIAAAPGHPNRERKLPMGPSLRLRKSALESKVDLVEAARRRLEDLDEGGADRHGLSWLVGVWEELDEKLRDPQCSVRDLFLLARHRVRQEQPPSLSPVEDPGFGALLRLCEATPRAWGETHRTHLQRVLDRWLLGGRADLDDPARRRGLTLAPIHAAKGHRWKAVFLLDTSDDAMPGKVGDYSQRVEREQRIFYTAVTRATRRLYLYCVADTGRGAAVRPTRFLDPIVHLVERRRVGMGEAPQAGEGTENQC